MDFDYCPEAKIFRTEVRQFLSANDLKSYLIEGEDAGYGTGAWSSAFQLKLGQMGWMSLTWPVASGGKGRPMTHKMVLYEEFASCQAPFAAVPMTDSIAQVVIELGTERLKHEVLPGISRGELNIWTGFSEPNAGSDLMAVRTNAVADGDSYLLEGQKTWSSSAHLADYGYVLARTNPNVASHLGLSVFLVNNKLPGITIRPVVNLAGERHLNEVFFDNVRVPKYCLIGAENKGINQMFKGLEHDRFWGRFVKPPYCRSILNELVSYLKEARTDKGLSDVNNSLRARLAESAIEIEVCRLLFYRIAWMIQTGQRLTYESSMAKVMADEMGQRLFRVGMEVLGLRGQLLSGSKWAPLHGKIARLYMVSLGNTLAGGTSEINRNTVAIRGLELSR